MVAIEKLVVAPYRFNCAYINGSKYDVHTCGKLLKTFLERLAVENPEMFEAVIGYDILKVSRFKKEVSIIEHSKNKSKLKQPTIITGTNYYIDTRISRYEALDNLQNVIAKAGLNGVVHVEVQ